MQSGDREGARAVLRRAQRAHPKDPDIARNLALLSQR
jgi:Flp pilus assembly protein TadD